MQLQHALSKEVQKREECETVSAEQKEMLAATGYELMECKNFLDKETGTNNRLKQELQQFKVSTVMLLVT